MAVTMTPDVMPSLTPEADPMMATTLDMKMPSGDDVRQMWGQCERELRVNTREYALNRAFDRGDQYLTWDSTLTDAVIRDFRDPRDQNSRTTVNLFRARRRGLTARVTASELAFNVRASSADDAGLRRQRLNHQVLEGLRTRQQWERIRAKSAKYALFGGVSAVCWEWDPKCRNAPPRLDGGLLLPAGGVKLAALAVTEFGIEPGSPSQEDATWWIRVTGAPPKQVQATYGMADAPRPDATNRSTPMARLLATRRQDSQGSIPLTNVYAYYRRPTPTLPGFVGHYVNGQVVAWSPWPFPHDDCLNLYVFSCDDPDESWIVDPWLSDARSVQAMYNDVRSTIREHAQRAANARMTAKEGAIEPGDLTDAPGEIVFWQGDAEGKPAWLAPPEVSRWLVGEVDRLQGELNDLLSQPEVARGIAPGDRNSGAALALLAEKADGPLGPFARDQARGWGVIATNVLRTLRFHMAPDEKRQTTMYGQANMPIPREWTREDIDADVEVLVPVEVTEPRSFAAVRAQMIELARTFPSMFAQMDPGRFARLLGLSSVQTMLRELDGSELVVWENELMFTGTPVMPDDWHDHARHITGHNEQRNTPAFEMLPEDRKQMFHDHVNAHKAMAAEAMAAATVAQEQAGLPPMGGPGVPPEAVSGTPAEGEHP